MSSTDAAPHPGSDRGRDNSERDKWEEVYASSAVVPETPALAAFNAEIAAIVRELLPDGGSILEAGCGGASQSLAIAQSGPYDLHLMDFSENALRLARQRFEQAGVKATFELGDVTEPGQPRYDLVFNAGVLEHYTLDQQVTFLRGMASRSKRYVLALVPNRFCYWYWVWRVAKTADSGWPYGKESPAADLSEAFERAGLHFAGHAFLGHTWSEDFINSLKGLDDRLKRTIIEIHRHGLVPLSQRAYLLAALGTVGRAPRRLPASFTNQRPTSETAQAELTGALADALSMRLQAESRLAESDRERRQLAQRVHELELELTQRVGEVTCLSAEARQNSQEAARLAGQLEARNEELSRLSAQVERWQTQADEWRSRATAAEQELASQSKRCDELADELAGVRQELEAARARIAGQEDELRNLRQELQQAEHRGKPGVDADELAKRLEETTAQLKAARSASDQHKRQLGELQRKLRFLQERNRDIARQLQDIWDSPTWQLLNHLHNSRIVGGTWRAIKALVPVRLKESLKARLRRRTVGRLSPTASKPETPREKQEKPASGTDSASSGSSAARQTADKPARPRSEAEVLDDLDSFLTRVDRSNAKDLVVFVAGVKFIESEGQRVTQIVRELIRHDVPVLLLYFRWRSEYHQPVPRSHDPHFFQMPMDLFDKHRKRIIERSFRPTLRRTCVFEFPYPTTFQWVNEFNLAGWKTVYDIIDDWEEFHQAGKAVWYEPAVEQYLCANSSAVAAIVPLLAEKAQQWVPGLKVDIIPNGVSPDSFDLTLPPKPLKKGRITVGYFGYLTPAWFDWELVADAARRRPDWQFHIVGYGEPVPIPLTDNVQLLGKVAHHLLYAYAQNWDVAIVPFKPTTLSKGADPIKVYEYLTLGLPVVAADIPHLRSYPGVYVLSDGDDFVELLEKAANNGLDRKVADEFIQRSTWHRRGLDLIEAGQRGSQNCVLPQAVLTGAS